MATQVKCGSCGSDRVTEHVVLGCVQWKCDKCKQCFTHPPQTSFNRTIYDANSPQGEFARQLRRVAEAGR